VCLVVVKPHYCLFECFQVRGVLLANRSPGPWKGHGNGVKCCEDLAYKCREARTPSMTPLFCLLPTPEGFASMVASEGSGGGRTYTQFTKADCPSE